MAIRVLWVIKGLGPGGAEQLLVNAARVHDRDRFDIECAYVLPWKDHLTEPLARAGVATHCLSTTRVDRRWPRRLRSLLNDGNFDVVHVHSPLPASVVRLAVRTLPRDRRPAVVTTEHNVWDTFAMPTRWANRLTGRWDDAVIAVTDEARASMRGAMAGKAETLAHGIDIAGTRALRSERSTVRAELGLGTDEFVIGTVANYRAQKNYPNLLRAARLLLDRGVPARIVAVGQGPLEAEIVALHQQLGLGDRLVLTGFRADASRVMAACDAFTLASEWEGLPVALMEALALGLPVVATAVGGVAEALHDGVDAVLVPASDPVALADGLQRIVEDDELRACLAAASAERSAKFDVTRAVRRLEEIYTAVAPARPPVEVTGEDATPKRPRRVASGLDIRRATPEDRPAILALCRQTLGWDEDPRFDALFAWKHDENPFGASPMWVAVEGDEVIGLRTFMRWEFLRGGQVLRAVRAVDTATHPDHQGKGLFTTLTMHGVEELTAEGVDFVFNTPNDKSLPGYVKMGWQVVGQLPAAFRVRSPGAAVRTMRARVPAELWSERLSVGEAFCDWIDRAELPPGLAPTDVRELRTNTGDAFYRWRYGTSLLGYRAVPEACGALVVRGRRRGEAKELVVLDGIGLTAAQIDRAAGRVLSAAGYDHALRAGGKNLAARFTPLPGGGPVLTFRALNQQAMPPLANWHLGMGDVELF